MKRFLSILLIGLFAVALVFAQEKAAKPQKAQKMECCKNGQMACSDDCVKMKSEMKGKCAGGQEADSADCAKMKSEMKSMSGCCQKADKTQKEAAPKKEAK